MAEISIGIYKLQSGRHVVCYIDPISGKRVRRKFQSLALAKGHQKNLELRYQAKGPQAFINEPIARLMDVYLEKFPESRVRERKNAFVSFCSRFGTVKVSDIGKAELESWFRGFQSERDLSDRTLSTIKSNLNSFFKFLVDENYLKHSPLFEIKFKRCPPPRRPRVVLSIEEVKALLDNAKKHSPRELYPFLHTLAHTGARKGEILKLKRFDVDFSSGLLNLRETKNGRARSIRMSQNLSSFLSTHLQSHNSVYVFPNNLGQMIGRGAIERMINQFKKHFPLEKDWGLHALRHSFANNYLRKGGEVYQLQAVLGHRHIQTTVDLYGQLAAQDVEKISPYED